VHVILKEKKKEKRKRERKDLVISIKDYYLYNSNMKASRLV
jgi:hypothetical protein